MVAAASLRTLVCHRFLCLELVKIKSCIVPAASDVARGLFVAGDQVMAIPLASVTAKGLGNVRA